MPEEQFKLGGLEQRFKTQIEVLARIANMATPITISAENVAGNSGRLVEQPAAVPPTREPSCNPTEASEEITSILSAIVHVRQRPLFALISDFIDNDVLNEVYTWKRELRRIGASNSTDILIHSPGGQLTACYMLARLFSRTTNSWEALVPEYAGSGATLICLGSSNIVMSEISQLGPLDPQVASKRQKKFFATERQSPLEAFEAVKYLREFATSSLDALMELLMEKGVAPEKALETATRLAADLVKPILEKIEPYDLGAFALDNRLAVTYCKEISRSTDSTKKTQRKAAYKALVEYYPAHEFAIDIVEAESLRMKVSEPTPELDELFDQLRPKLAGIKAYIGLVPTAERGAS